MPPDLLLTIIVSASCCAIIFIGASNRRLRSMWVLKALLLLCGTTLVFKFPLFCYITFVFWILLLIVPILLVATSVKCLELEELTLAKRFAQVALVLHPFEEPLALVAQCRILKLLGTKEILLNSTTSPTRVPSEFQILLDARRSAFRQDWKSCLSILNFKSCENSETLHALSLLMIAHSLGELERISELLELVEYCDKYRWKDQLDITRLRMLLILFAYTGRTEITQRLVETALAHLDSSTSSFWKAVALDNAGQHALAKEIFSRLQHHDCSLLACHAAHRLARPTETVPYPAPAILELEADSDRVLQFLYGTKPNFPAGLVGVSLILLVIYISNYFKLLPLHSLLRLDTHRVIHDFEVWRLLSAGFIHNDLDHLLFNFLALGVLGFFIERRHGALVLVALFLVGNLAASTFMILSTILYGNFYALGASGATMSMLGFALYQCHKAANRWNLKLAASYRRKLIIVVVLQGLIDATFTDITLLGHLGGIAGGLIFSLFFAL